MELAITLTNLSNRFAPIFVAVLSLATGLTKGTL
jgi:hypothetical protein